MASSFDTSNLAAEERARVLVDAVKNQINGEDLPKLDDLDGATIVLRVREGSLHWATMSSEHCW